MPEPISIIALISALAPIAKSGFSKILESETVQNLGGSVLGGPVEEVSGNFAATAFNKLIGSLPKILESPENHDLLRSVRRSYLNATLVMCFARLQVINPSKFDVKNLGLQLFNKEEPNKIVETLKNRLLSSDNEANKEIEWLFRAINYLQNEIESIPNWEVTEIFEDATKNVQLMLKPQNANTQISNIKAKLKTELVAELASTAYFQTFDAKESVGKEHYGKCLPPELLESINKGWFLLKEDGTFLRQNNESKIDFEWFDVLSVFFAEEIKTNTRVSNIFNARMLAELKYQNGQPCNFSADDFAEKLAESNKVFARSLANIEKEVGEIGGNVKLLLPLLSTIESVNVTVQIIHNEIVEIGKDLKKLLKLLKQSGGGESSTIEEPEISDEVISIIREGQKLQSLGKYEEAKVVLEKAKELAISCNDFVGKIEAKRILAWILNEWNKDANAAFKLLQECLTELRGLKFEKSSVLVLYLLGAIEMYRDHLDDAKFYLSESLTLAEKFNQKKSIGLTLQVMGQLENRRGKKHEALELYDKSLTHCLGIYQKDATDNDAIEGIAICYQQKGNIFWSLGNSEDTETNFVKAIEYFRKVDRKLGIGAVLRSLAQLKFIENQYESGIKMLDEATKIFEEMNDTKQIIQCLDLKGRLFWQLREDYGSVWEKILLITEEAFDYKMQVQYLVKFGDEDTDNAKEYYNKAEKISLREGILRGYVNAILGLIRLAKIENNYEEQKRLLAEGIKYLNKALPSIESAKKRIFVTTSIADLYNATSNFSEALLYFQKAKKAFEVISDVQGIAVCLDQIARIYSPETSLENENAEFDTLLELKKLIDGTNNYRLLAKTALSLHEIEMKRSNINAANVFLREAELLCRNHNLHEFHYQFHILQQRFVHFCLYGSVGSDLFT
jgi:tetratricopeptide (TPR) repeat protein